MNYFYITLVSLVGAVIGWLYIKKHNNERKIESKLNKLLSMHNIFFFFILIGLGCLYVAILENYGYSLLKIIKLNLLSMGLYIAAIIDRQHYVIPNRIVIALLAISLCFIFGEIIVFPEYSYNILVDSGLGLLIGAGCFLLAALIAKDSVGMGDVKLFGVIGIFVGMNIFSVLILSLLLSAIIALTLMLLKKKSRKDVLPMGPFAFLGTVLSILLGY